MRGQVTATLSALLGGYATQTDYAAVAATFLNAGGAPAGALRLAAVSPGDRNSVTALVARSASATVPAGTRQISVRIDAVREEGSYNDGYIDNVSLVLGSGGGPVFHKTVVVKVVSGKVRVRRPGSNEFVDLTGSDGIPLGSTVDTTAGVVELTSVPKAGGDAADRPSSTRASSRSRRSARSRTSRSPSRWRRAAAAAQRGGDEEAASATCGATARAPSGRPASTARRRCAARSGSSRTAAPAP